MRKLLAPLFLTLALAAGSLPAQAAEPKHSEEQQSFLERYTNAAQDVILQGLKLVGVNYRRGGNDEDSGLDCSGFVRLVFKETIGTLLPRTSREMSEVGERVDSADLKPGDLVFFNTRNRPRSHVGIYIGDDRFVHAPNSRGKVRTESLKQGWFAARFEEGRSYFD